MPRVRPAVPRDARQQPAVEIAVVGMDAVATGGAGGNSIAARGVIGQAAGELLHDMLGCAFTQVRLFSGNILNGYGHDCFISSRPGRPA